MDVAGDGGTIEHAQLVHGTGMVMLGSDRDNEFADHISSGGVASISLYVIVDDVAGHAERAGAAGAEILMKPEEHDYDGSNYTARPGRSRVELRRPHAVDRGELKHRRTPRLSGSVEYEADTVSEDGGSAVKKVLVSGCLNGRPIRFNATNVEVVSAIWDRWESEGRLVAFCPELAAGFPVPRAPAEIVGSTATEVLLGNGVVQEDNGTDVTAQFVEGARLAVERAVAAGCVAAVLTDGSPSCGTTYTYDGTFGGGTLPGMGVTAQLLHDQGLAVFPENQIEQADEYLRSIP